MNKSQQAKHPQQPPNTHGLDALAALCGGVSMNYMKEEVEVGTSKRPIPSGSSNSSGGVNSNAHHQPQQNFAPLHEQHQLRNMTNLGPQQQQQQQQQGVGTQMQQQGQPQQNNVNLANNLLAQQAALNFYLQQQLLAATQPHQQTPQQPALNDHNASQYGFQQVRYDVNNQNRNLGQGGPSGSQHRPPQQMGQQLPQLNSFQHYQPHEAYSNQHVTTQQIQSSPRIMPNPSNAPNMTGNYEMPPPPSRNSNVSNAAATFEEDDHPTDSCGSVELDPDKKQLKRAANRRSAQLSRKRKKQFIEELRSENQELRKKELILRSIPDLIVVFDSAGKIHFLSHSVTKLLNFPPGELEGSSFWDRISGDSVRLLKSAFMDALAARKPGTDTAPLEGVSILKMVDRHGNIIMGTMNGIVHFSGDAPECVCSIRPVDVTHETKRRDVSRVNESAATVVSLESGIETAASNEKKSSDGGSVFSESESERS